MTHGTAWPVIRSMSRRPAETCRRHHMPIEHAMAQSGERQTATGSEEPMRPAMGQTASLPLHGMFCREGHGGRVQWMRRAH
jgi:hypothetical protein